MISWRDPPQNSSRRGLHTFITPSCITQITSFARLMRVRYFSSLSKEAISASFLSVILCEIVTTPIMMPLLSLTGDKLSINQSVWPFQINDVSSLIVCWEFTTFFTRSTILSAVTLSRISYGVRPSIFSRDTPYLPVVLKYTYRPSGSCMKIKSSVLSRRSWSRCSFSRNSHSYRFRSVISRNATWIAGFPLMVVFTPRPSTMIKLPSTRSMLNSIGGVVSRQDHFLYFSGLHRGSPDGLFQGYFY